MTLHQQLEQAVREMRENQPGANFNFLDEDEQHRQESKEAAVDRILNQLEAKAINDDDYKDEVDRCERLITKLERFLAEERVDSNSVSSIVTLQQAVAPTINKSTNVHP